MKFLLKMLSTLLRTQQVFYTQKVVKYIISYIKLLYNFSEIVLAHKNLYERIVNVKILNSYYKISHVEYYNF